MLTANAIANMYFLSSLELLINNSNIIDSGSGLYINGNNVGLDYIKLTNGGVYLTPNSKNFSINSVSVNDKPLVYLNYTSNVLISNAGEVIAFNSRNLYIKNSNLKLRNKREQDHNNDMSLQPFEIPIYSPISG